MFRTLAIAATTATLAAPAFADGHARYVQAYQATRSF